MNSIANSYTFKILGAAASLAALMAVTSAANLCCFWFNQPKTPESVRMLSAK